MFQETYHYSSTSSELKQFLKERNERFQQEQLFYVWFCYQPFICFVKAEAVKQLLSKGKIKNEKSWHYDFPKLLLGEGLITSQLRLPDSNVQPIAIMPLSRMENTTFVMPSIIDSHNMGLRTVLQSRCPKRNAYSANQRRTPVLPSFALCRNFLLKIYATFAPEVHERVFRSGGQSDVKPPSVKFRNKLGTRLPTH
ncbi:hypothetical protein TNCV_3614921 [Trichonephila clavipes]|nr:hypothetical protein TNCV_3614921 [Trichonephila clavipes]